MIMRTMQPKSQNFLAKPRALAATISLRRLVGALWLGIREWCGDSAYERYVQAQKTKTEKSCLLTPGQFYVERVNRRYSRPNRCC